MPICLWVMLVISLGAAFAVDEQPRSESDVPTTCFVAPWGSDSDPGTEAAPFRTIQHAADQIQPGQTCIIRGGRYQETVRLKKSGVAGLPVTFISAADESVTVDGTDPVDGDWISDNGRLYRIPLDQSTDQVFFQDRAMTPARWPNMTFDENWDDRKKWARTEPGTERGRVIAADLAGLPESLIGGQIFIKVGKGNNAFTRDIIAHSAGQSDLRWDDQNFYDAPRLTGEDGRSERIRTFGLENNRFFIFNHRTLLDAPQEWFYSKSTGELLFLPPGETVPESGEVRVKRRVYGFSGDQVEHLEIRNIHFFACSLEFTGARDLTIDNCQFIHPYELHTMRDNQQAKNDQRPVFLQGERCVLRKCLVKYAPGTSIHVVGRANRIENCMVTEGCRHGRHGDPNVSLEYDRARGNRLRDGDGINQRWAYTTSEGNTISRSTICMGGGIGVYLPGPGPGTAEYNHLFNLGLYCSDVSALYIPRGQNRAWSGFHHNWLHDNNGIGMRCDQDGQQVRFHHNVVWNCKAGGKANGYEFQIYHNTVLINNPDHPLLMVRQKQVDVVADWPIQNNTAFRLADRMDLREWNAMTSDEKAQRSFIMDIPESSVIHHNYLIRSEHQQILFVSSSEEAPDLRPLPEGPLIDSGIVIPGINDQFEGSAPDIGAYEHKGPYWTAGADWWPDQQMPPGTMAEATRRAHAMTNGRRLYRDAREVYSEQ
jgi:hypothetical protein